MSRVNVLSLRIGQRVDLECDPIADPGNDGDKSDHPEFAYEFEVVESIERETEDCVCVYFESGFTCGFPVDHDVDVDPEQVFNEGN